MIPTVQNSQFLKYSHENLNEYAKRLPPRKLNYSKYSGAYYLNVYRHIAVALCLNNVYDATKRNIETAQNC